MTPLELEAPQPVVKVGVAAPQQLLHDPFDRHV